MEGEAAHVAMPQKAQKKEWSMWSAKGVDRRDARWRRIGGRG